MSRLLHPAVVALTLLATPSPARAQSFIGIMRDLLTPFPTSGAMPDQVFSTNPIGLAFGLYNFDYEVRASDSVTLGAGASRFGGGPWLGSGDGPHYTNGDVYVRYYPSRRAFNGLALGAKVGMTDWGDGTRRVGLGFDLNQNGTVNDHLVMSAGIGAKRLVGSQFGVVPTFRFNIGVGF